MKNYILGIATATILSVASEIILPERMKKYISLITGAILLISLLNPVLKFRRNEISFDEDISFDYNKYDTNEILYEEFKTRVKKDIENRIKSEFNIEITAEIEPQMNKENIVGVKRITLASQYNAEIKERLTFVYGCHDIKFYGGD